MIDGQRFLVATMTLAILVVATACGSGPFLTGGRSAAEVFADGEAEVERHLTDPLALPVDIPELRSVGEGSTRPAHVDSRTSFGYTPTQFIWFYRLADGVDADAALDAAVSALEERGARFEGSLGTSRLLSAESLGDVLDIKIQPIELPDRTQINHFVTIRSG